MTGENKSTAQPPLADDTTGHGIEGASTRAAEIVATQKIGPYIVLKTLGRGGMSTVYLARDPRTNRDVALKVIPAGPDADQTDLARFQTEAEAVARLDHPNIVRLFEVGKADDVAFLAMEYVDGGTLYRKIKNGQPVDPLEAARLVEQIARATHYAHQRGVIHRDLKPSNILMKKAEATSTGPDSTIGIPKLADFGLARQLDRSLRLTVAGTAVGTPHYMAPEQARGERTIGPELDIHGVGAILYELLTGLPPFQGDTPQETMEQVVHKQPTPPSRVRQGIPPALESICLKCLEKEPRNRYRTAAALADDLHRFLENPAETRRIRTAAEKARTVRRTLLAIGSGLALATLAILTTALITSGAKRAQIDELRHRADAAEFAARRSKLEAAIALCEQGQIRLGIDQMRALESEPDLPVREVIAAWQGRLIELTTTIPTMRATVAAMSPNGELLATADGDRVQIWKTADWSSTGVDWKLDGQVSALGWSEDGIRLAIGAVGGKVFLGDVHKGQLDPKPFVAGNGQAIAGVGFAFPGVRVIYAGDKLRQEFVPPVTKNKASPFDLDYGPFAAVGIAPMTGDAAVVTAIGSVRVYDAMDARWRDLPPDGDVTAVAYSPDANVLVTGTRAGTVRLWDAVARTPLTDAVSVGGRVNAVAIGYGEAGYLVVVFPENAATVALRCARPWIGPPIRLPDGPGKEVLGVALAQGATKVFVTSPFGVSLWRVRDAKRYGPVRDHSASDRYGPSSGKEARFSAPAAVIGEESILVGGSGGKMFLMSDDDRQSKRVAEGDRDTHEVTAVVVGPNGQTSACLQSKGDRTTVRHWSGGMDTEPKSREFNTRVHQEAMLPDGSVLLACADGRVRIWDPTSNQERAELNCGSPVLAVAASDDGKRILAGCADGTARLWDLADGSELLQVRHRAEIRGVAFHGSELLTASADGTARRWHAETGLALGPAFQHPDAISALALSGQFMATGGRGRYVRVWRLN